MSVSSSAHKSKMHEIISKDSSRIVIAVSVSAFILVFALIASQSLISQSFYQNRIISEKKSTLKIVNKNKEEANTLNESYQLFATEAINIIGGNPNGVGPRDGDNAKIILDALPDQLDYPALSSSIEKILVDGGYTIQSIGGGSSLVSSEEDPVDGSDGTTQAAPEPEEIAYPFRVAATPQTAVSLLQTLESSIRPFVINSIGIDVSGGNLELSIDTKTYFQPSSGLQVGSKVVK